MHNITRTINFINYLLIIYLFIIYLIIYQLFFFNIILLIFFSGVGPYDIALIKLSSALKLSSNVKTIALPAAGSEPTGIATLCGWGSTSTTSTPTMPDKLQEVNLPYVDLVTCSDAVRRLTGSSPVHETNVCTGPLTGGISACSVSFKLSVNYGNDFLTVY